MTTKKDILKIVANVSNANEELYMELSRFSPMQRAERLRTLANFGLLALKNTAPIIRPTPVAEPIIQAAEPQTKIRSVIDKLGM
jgi:hypothetical protein